MDQEINNEKTNINVATLEDFKLSLLITSLAVNAAVLIGYLVIAYSARI